MELRGFKLMVDYSSRSEVNNTCSIHVINVFCSDSEKEGYYRFEVVKYVRMIEIEAIVESFEGHFKLSKWLRPL